jgi:hypothetical protein
MMKFIHDLIFFLQFFIYDIKNVFAYKDWLSFSGTGILNNNRNGDEELIFSCKCRLFEG